MLIPSQPPANRGRLPEVRGLCYERAVAELFPLSREKISASPDAVPTKHEIEFASRLRNLPLGLRTAVVCPMTGMERAAEFLRGFYGQLNDGTQVLPIVTAKQTGSVDLEAIAKLPSFERVVVIDASCRSTYYKIMGALGDLGVPYTKLRALPLEHDTTLHLGGDLNISALKCGREPKSRLLSEALELWRAGQEIGVFEPPNPGLQRALGIGVYFGLPEAVLDQLGEVFAPAELRAKVKSSLLGKFQNADALPPFTPMTAEIYAFDENFGAGCQAFAVEARGHLLDYWGSFQEQVSRMPAELFDSIHAQVLSYESTYREAFRALGQRFAAIAEGYPKNCRFSMPCLPRHLEGLGPDRHYERGC